MSDPVNVVRETAGIKMRHERDSAVSHTAWSARMRDAHTDRAALLALVARLAEAIDALAPPGDAAP